MQELASWEYPTGYTIVQENYNIGGTEYQIRKDKNSSRIFAYRGGKYYAIMENTYHVSETKSIIGNIETVEKGEHPHTFVNLVSNTGCQCVNKYITTYYITNSNTYVTYTTGEKGVHS